MPRRFPLLVLVLAAALSGCATVSEERLSLLESAVLDLQAQEMRLASLEDTVAGLVARNRSVEAQASATTPPVRPEDLHTKPGPRRVYADPAPAPAVPAASPAPSSPPAAPKPAPQPVASRPAPVKKISDAQAARQYQSALSTLESGRPQAALNMFREFLADYPGHALAPNAGYWLGECYYSMKQYDSAIIAFKDVVAQHPAHEKAAAAMLKAGYSYDLLGDGANARFYLETLTRDYPASQPASLARTKLASL